MAPRRSEGRLRKSKSQKSKAKLSRTKKPDGMSLEDWQIELRRQFGREQPFRLANRGEHPVFSGFAVTNPQSGNTYTVTIRGRGLGDNACTCPDFTTNTLGTCKHIEFTLARLERKRDARRQLREGYQPPSSEVFLQYGSRREVRFRPGAECPVELARLASVHFDATGILLPEAREGFDDFLQKARELEPLLTCGDDVLAYLAELHDAAARRQRVAEMFPAGVRSAAFKTLLTVPLYDYQREGALFAARAGRCLIGDEMGLGKTIQAIAAAEIMAKLFGVERVLIVCPTSLKHQWHREIERFTGRTAGIIGGLRPRRQAQYAEPGQFFKITNYDTVHADLEAIEAWGPDLVILDEAQRIKNWATRVARSVKKLAAPYAIVLTGTPLENRLEELISIVQFVDLYRLGPTFKLLHDHQVLDDVGKVVGYRDLDQIGKTLEPLLIRRQKEQVLDQLPERIDSNLFVPMTDHQKAEHEMAKEVVARIVMKWRRYGFLTEADKIRLMTQLQIMRMVCDSTYLLDGATEHGTKADEATTLLGELLERPNTKVVVFSQWLRMHELLIKRLGERGIGHGFFNGSLSGKQRRDLVDRFREDPECKVFLATDAAGVGLNLQHANVVFNMDLPWNPAVLEQRIGRVHRLGQTQPVRVVNFVARGTIEEGMLGLLQFKKSLFKGVLDGGDSEVSLGGSRLKRFMESVEAATEAIPTPHPADQAEETPEPHESVEPTPGPEGAKPTGPTTPAPTEPAPVGDAWTGLLQAGMALLQTFVQPTASGNGPATTSSRQPLVRKDPASGEAYLHLPVPPVEVLTQVVGAIQQLLQGLQNRGT